MEKLALDRTMERVKGEKKKRKEGRIRENTKGFVGSMAGTESMLAAIFCVK